MDYVVHAAALKQVPACEYNPVEAIKTNVDGSVNVIDACLDAGVKRCLLVSSDKAVAPVNLYGATKMCAERLFLAANAYSGDKGCHFLCVRYGNVLESRGSVLNTWKTQADTGQISITHPEMTRFLWTLTEASGFVLSALNSTDKAPSCSISVPILESARIVDLAKTVYPDHKLKVSGIRTGEKLHESLISADESLNYNIKRQRKNSMLLLPKKWSTDSIGKHWTSKGYSSTPPTLKQPSQIREWLNQRGLL